MPLLTVSRLTLACISILALGSVVNMAAYGSVEPVAICAILGLPFLIIFRLKGFGGLDEWRSFLAAYSVGWFWAGVAAGYANFANDPSQTGSSDAAYFFDVVTGKAGSGLSVQALSVITEGAGSVVAWRYLYDFLSYFGFEKGRYIGVTLNMIFVALSAVVGVRIMKTVFGQDRVRIDRFILVFTLCGVFWLYAAIHNRDAAILLAVSLLALYWVRYLKALNTWNLLQLAGVTVVSFFVFGFLRAEFVFVPAAMLIAGIAAAAFGAKSRGTRIKLLAVVVLLALPIAGYMVSTMQSGLIEALVSGKENYAAEGMQQSASGSLGEQLIVNQALPLRLLFGSAYLFIFPIPFWTGFQLESAYHLLKSFHVVYMYAITPLFALSVWRILRSKTLRTMPVMFLLVVITGFTLSIAYTSLETRHFGAFLTPLLVVSMLPGISEPRDRSAYRKLLAIFLGGMFLIHSAWMALKLL